MIDWQKVSEAKGPPTLGREIFQVRVSEISPNGLFNICSVAEYLQEAAFRNSTSLNLGMEALKGTSLAWVLARLGVFVQRYPERGEAVTVETWYAGLQGRFGNRFYRLLDEQNNILASALTTFALFDLEKRGIAEWPDFIFKGMPEAGPCAVSFQQRTLKKPTSPTVHPEFSPRLGDIDLYNHVNNTKLIEWALSATAVDHEHPFQPRALDVLFRNECRLNDTLKAETEQLDEHNDLVLLSDPSGKEFIRAQITR